MVVNGPALFMPEGNLFEWEYLPELNHELSDLVGTQAKYLAF